MSYLVLEARCTIHFCTHYFSPPFCLQLVLSGCSVVPQTPRNKAAWRDFSAAWSFGAWVVETTEFGTRSAGSCVCVLGLLWTGCVITANSVFSLNHAGNCHPDSLVAASGPAEGEWNIPVPPLKRASTSVFLKNLFICYFWPCWVFVAAHKLSLVVVSGGYYALRWVDFSLWWLLLCGARALGTQALGTGASVVVACGPSCPTHSMWNLPRPGVKPVSPALAGGFLLTVPLGNSLPFCLIPCRL